MITMGSDEFILYIRKQHPNCQMTTIRLGWRIALWMRGKGFYNSKAKKGESFCKNEIKCLWMTTENEEFIKSISLPISANQYTFDRALLSQLYDFLDVLGQNQSN